MKNKHYCAIIGDINKSRKLTYRGRTQKKFQRAIDSINREYKHSIASRFLITIGDEFQGLLKSPADAYAVVKRFESVMAPVPFSFGIGIGTLSTPLRKESLGMDGQVFYNARTAIERAKKEKKSIVFCSDEQSEYLLNSLVSLMDIYWNRLTQRQQQIITLFKELQNQKLIAKKLRISQPAVTKTLTSTGAYSFIDAEKSIAKYLQSLTQPY